MSETIADLVAAHPRDGIALIGPDATLTWGEYDDLSSRLATAYVRAGWRPGERLAVLLTGGALTHVAYLAAQKAGLVTVGIGPRAGDAEIAHLLRVTGASALVTRATHRGRPVADIPAPRHVVLALHDGQLTVDGVPAFEKTTLTGLDADELFFLNSTSGTTGRPKCVRQTMDMRKVFAPLAREAGNLGADEVVASVLPAPYGFGLWSAHIMPAVYGYPTVLTEEFSPAETLRLVQAHRVTVLAAVTSQFIMLLNAPGFAAADLSSLRVLFTGGERVPYARAAEFEDRTGCRVLQFYGSNEAGPISVTRVSDDRPHRLGTVGRPIPSARLRLLPPDGRIAVNGPGCSDGYYNDDSLVGPDGWLLTGDLGELDTDGYLRVTGRASDFIIRGGHNISALAVEEAVGGHPRVAQVAVVAVPDEVLGERVCAYVVTVDGVPLGLRELREHLDANGVSKHNWPEHLVCRPSLPLGTGGKVDKAALRGA